MRVPNWPNQFHWLYIWINGIHYPSRHIVIGYRFALVISNLLKWQSKLHNPKSLSLHTDTDACAPLILYSPTAYKRVCMCNCRQGSTPWKSQKRQVNVHMEPPTATPAVKEEEKTWQKKADGNCRWKVKFLLKAGFTSDSRHCPLCSSGDDHLHLKFLSLFSGSSGLTESPRHKTTWLLLGLTHHYWGAHRDEEEDKTGMDEHHWKGRGND